MKVNNIVIDYAERYDQHGSTARDQQAGSDGHWPRACMGDPRTTTNNPST